jgi:hypothetical protein
MEEGMAKTLILALVATGVPALIVWAAPDLIVIGFLFLIVPGIVMSLLPTIFLYLCVFSAAWFVTRKQGEGQAALYGLAGLAVVAFGLPMFLNNESEALWAEARAREVRPKQPVKSASTVLIDLPRIYGREGCNELCQLLLFNGAAQRVVVRMERGKAPKEFRLTREDCRLDLAEMDKMMQVPPRNWSSAERAGLVAMAAKSRIAMGECLASEESKSDRADLTIRWIDENSDFVGSALKLEARAPWNRGVEVSMGGQVVGRETVSSLSLLTMPLYLEPIGSGMGFRGWRWGRKGERVEETKIDRIAILQRLTAFDLETPRGLGTTSAREVLDAALADEKASNAAFVLLGEYYKSLREEGFDSRDRERLTKLVLDSRVTDFSYFNWSEKQRADVRPPMRDAMLRRLLRLSENMDDSQQRGVFVNLANVAARLGPNAYAGDVPLLDELMANVKLRAWMPDLIRRYADQGKAGAEKLVRIAEDAPSQTGREIEAARAGLCLVGVSAQEYLPRLRRVEGNFTQGHAWRGMLIAMGAKASEFSHPNYKEQGKYEESLRKEARACLDGKVRR